MNFDLNIIGGIKKVLSIIILLSIFFCLFYFLDKKTSNCEVFASASGKYYYFDNSRWSSNIKDKVCFIDETQAIRAGYSYR